MKRVIVASIAAMLIGASVVGAYAYRSPQYAVWRMTSLASDQRLEEFAKYIDQPRLADSLATSFYEVANLTEGDRAADLAGVMSPSAMLPSITSTYSSPYYVAAYFRLRPASTSLIRAFKDPSIIKESDDSFYIRGNSGQRHYIFERDGWTWKLIGSEVPPA